MVKEVKVLKNIETGEYFTGIYLRCLCFDYNILYAENFYGEIKFDIDWIEEELMELDLQVITMLVKD